MAQLTSGFTVLADWREMGSLLLSDVIEECQKRSVSAGMSKVARVYSNPTFKEVQADSMSQRTGIVFKVFYNINEAEVWLDEIGSDRPFKG